MTEKLKQLFKEELAGRPKEIQESISAVNWEKTSEEIGKKYILTDEEINDLQTEVGILLLGLANIEDITKNVENEICTSNEVAEKITQEVSKKILEPIYKLLAKNVRESLSGKKIKLNQNINFILSGGNYSSFLE